MRPPIFPNFGASGEAVRPEKWVKASGAGAQNKSLQRLLNRHTPYSRLAAVFLRRCHWILRFDLAVGVHANNARENAPDSVKPWGHLATTKQPLLPHC
jgi:hypothetical protein